MRTLLLVPWLLLASPALAEEVDLGAYIQGAIALYNDVAPDPVPYPTSKDLQKILDGEVVKVRRRQVLDGDTESHHRVVGFLLVPQPRLDVWLTALDPNFSSSSILTDHRIDRDDTGWSRWYQHVRLPWPITDRHWVIDIDKRRDVFDASQGLIWEHRWHLADGGEQIARDLVARGEVRGLTAKDIEDAVYLPANRGGWVLVELTPDQTLMVYHVSTDVGGSIPESWIATFAMSQLDELLQQVARASASIHDTYDPTGGPIYDGGGQPILTSALE